MSMHASVVSALLALPRNAWPGIAAKADIPLPTLMKVAYGHSPNPRIKTVEALAQALAQPDK